MAHHPQATGRRVRVEGALAPQNDVKQPISLFLSYQLYNCCKPTGKKDIKKHITLIHVGRITSCTGDINWAGAVVNKLDFKIKKPS